MRSVKFFADVDQEPSDATQGVNDFHLVFDGLRVVAQHFLGALQGEALFFYQVIDCTDIVYVLEGTATLVTGGVPVGTKTVAPQEIRGSSVTGGETTQLVPGDVIIIPNGVPHWFKDVSAPFNYYVVKVR